MKTTKKVIIILLVVILLVGGTCGAAYAAYLHNVSKKTVDVIAVSDINNEWFMEDSTTSSSGMVSNDASQIIYGGDKTITSINVVEGANVSIGDVLIQYDTTETDLQIEMKMLDIQATENDMIKAQRELDKLKTITPVPDEADDDSTTDTDTEDDSEETQKEAPAIFELPQKEGDAYNYIDENAKAYSGKGTTEDPYHFMVTEGGYVYGSYLNYLINKEKVAVFDVFTENDRKNGKISSSWLYDGNNATQVDDSSKWEVVSKTLLVEENEDLTPEEAEEEEEEDDTDTSNEVVYTVSELAKAIQEKEESLENNDILKRKKQLELKKLEKTREDFTVKASVNGIVKRVGDITQPLTSNDVAVEITGTQGLYVTGSISELMLNQIEVGQDVTISSWSNGQTYVAKITEISQYPTSSNDYYGEGNTNVSYYPFTVYIENSEGLSSGEAVDMSITGQVQTEDTETKICIEKAYVRKENGKSYVMIADADNKLKKQYVNTGKTYYGYAIEVKAGLSINDRIAFPYGKDVKEGVAAVDGSADEMYY